MPQNHASVRMMLIELLCEQNGIIEILRGQREIPPRGQLLHVEAEQRIRRPGDHRIERIRALQLVFQPPGIIVLCHRLQEALVELLLLELDRAAAGLRNSRRTRIPLVHEQHVLIIRERAAVLEEPHLDLRAEEFPERRILSIEPDLHVNNPSVCKK